jgi:hypothetical protein
VLKSAVIALDPSGKRNYFWQTQKANNIVSLKYPNFIQAAAEGSKILCRCFL